MGMNLYTSPYSLEVNLLKVDGRLDGAASVSNVNKRCKFDARTPGGPQQECHCSIFAHLLSPEHRAHRGAELRADAIARDERDRAALAVLGPRHAGQSPHCRAAHPVRAG